MKKITVVLLVVVMILFSGCDAAHISLEQAKLQVFSDGLELDLTIGNSGEAIRLLPLEFKLIDINRNEFLVVDFTGDLDCEIGKGYQESVSGTAIFPPLDVENTRVRIKIVSEVLSSGQRFVSIISGVVENGIIEEMSFGN